MSIFQTSLPFDPLDQKALPGIQSLAPNEWLLVDDAYAAQMAERERLLSDVPDRVLAQSEGAGPAVAELLDEVLAHLTRDHVGFERRGTIVRCPDGREVDVGQGELQALARLVQNDFAILQKSEDQAEHILTAGVLCFPANWRLEEKFMRPLSTIHDPVDEYNEVMARRVQRLFDGVQVDRPLWRFNALWYDDPTLHQPLRTDSRLPSSTEKGAYMRSERQTIYRLPLTRAVVFGIHTFVLPEEALA